MNFKSFVLILLLPVIMACTDGETKAKDMFFGGLIVNPTSKFVVLLKQEIVIDTFFLDEQNKFGGKLKNAEKGLYVFKHPPENQVIYLEPGDSTLILLNTIEFDESLNFSGKGAEKNNYLNYLYLKNQENNNFILSCFNLSPVQFSEKTDSIRTGREKKLEKLRDRHRFSNEFLELAKASINYEYYDLRERYAYLIRKHKKEQIKNIPSNFHDYRRNIDFQEERLENYYVYLNFLDDFLRTRSLEICQEKNFEAPDCYDHTSLTIIEQRIRLADSVITNKSAKDLFIAKFAAQGLIYSKNTEDIQEVLQLLDDIGYSGNRREDLEQMAGIQNSLLPGKNIGTLKLLNTNRDTIDLKNTASGPKITYHWSLNSQSQYKAQQKIINRLRNKFPQVTFIGVNIDRKHWDEWQDVIQKEPFVEHYEYKLNLVRINEELLKNYLNKLIFIDPAGKILRGDVQISDPYFELDIEEFVDRQRYPGY